MTPGIHIDYGEKKKSRKSPSEAIQPDSGGYYHCPDCGMTHGKAQQALSCCSWKKAQARKREYDRRRRANR